MEAHRGADHAVRREGDGARDRVTRNARGVVEGIDHKLLRDGRLAGEVPALHRCTRAHTHTHSAKLVKLPARAPCGGSASGLGGAAGEGAARARTVVGCGEEVLPVARYVFRYDPHVLA